MLLPDHIKYIPAADPSFPALLRQIGSPPQGLFFRGVLNDLPAISIVGTRRNTSYGRRCIEEIVPDLVAAGFSIISGLALGIDGLVHRAVLRAGGKTIAILGTGIDEKAIYPRAHVNLAHEIIHSGGAIVSEFPAGTGSRKEHFPIRNRLIAGWSLATLVIEADMDSGSLITAKQALEANREVLAVPGPIWSDVSRGCNKLISAGARVCMSANDVLESLEIDRPDLVSQARALLPLTSDESRILDLLSEPHHVDDIIVKTGLDAGSVGAKLTVLEVKGYIAQLGGQIWGRSHGRLRK
ncbi:DNA-protecting protein DprA [Candidatus Uhrbacteria bacterium]|nr:DNA-protecting protein DprA [Candidatus Uhrbacteria bacterium]